VTFIAIYEKNVQSLQGIEFFTELEYLFCQGNQLKSLDLSKNTLLRTLGCDENQLTSLDLSKNTLLMILDCSYNQLTSLDISTLTALESLQCHDNQLTSLDVSNTALVYIECYRNQLKGAAMEAFVKGLPEITSGKEWDGLLYIVCNEDEGNEITTSQVAAAQAKGWKPYYYDGEKNSWEPYDDIKPVLRGDVNEDGVVNGTDIQEVINIIVNAE
jgi:Leucine-rich repeat (LRR) protein